MLSIFDKACLLLENRYLLTAISCVFNVYRALIMVDIHVPHCMINWLASWKQWPVN